MAPLICPKCQTPCRSGAKFCRACGAALPARATAPRLNPPAGKIEARQPTQLCPHCQHSNALHARYCAKCGKPLNLAPRTPRALRLPSRTSQPIACPSCGQPNRPKARHCVRCGSPMAAQKSAAPPQPPAKPAVQQQISINVGGNLNGNVAIGDHNFQVNIGDVNGGEVKVIAPQAVQPPQPRLTPANLRPDPFPGLLDRQAEVTSAVQALAADQAVEFSGAPGAGKTSLLHHLAHHPAMTNFPDGVVYLPVGSQPVEDILQFLFDSFYECGTMYKATEAEMRRLLHGKKAVILLDDVELPREQVEMLLDSVPNCAFIWAAPERRLWRKGQAVELRGLPPAEALKLVEQELGRALSPAEIPGAQSLVQVLAGHPLRLLQAVNVAKRQRLPFGELAKQLQGPIPAESLRKRIMAALSEAEQRLVSALAALRGAPVAAKHLAAVTGVQNITASLQALQSMRLVQAHSPRYSLVGTLAWDVSARQDLTSWYERFLDYFTLWAESLLKTDSKNKKGGKPPDESPMPEMEAMLQVLRWGSQTSHWQPVLRLARAIEAWLALERRWTAWEEVLNISLAAARGLADRSAEAWALHQLGIRALALGRKQAARLALSSALRLRQALGEKSAAQLTLKNMELAGISPLPAKEVPKPSAKTSFFGRLLPVLSGASLAILAILTIGGTIVVSSMIKSTPLASRQSPTPSHTVSIPPTPRRTATPTRLSYPPPTNTFTPRPSETLVSTPTGTPIFHPLDCITFEDTVPYSYSVGDSFVSAGTLLNVQPFLADYSPGFSELGWLFLDYIDGTMQATTYSTLLDFNFGTPISYLTIGTFLYEDSYYDIYTSSFTNTVNLSINGDFRQLWHIFDLNHIEVGGVSIIVEARCFDPDCRFYTGMIVFRGPIESFAIGAEYLRLDNICPVR